MSADPTAMHRRPRQRRRLVLSFVVACVTAFSAEAVPAMAAPLPDGRGYEMVTPVDKNGIETGPGIGSVNGNAVNWESIGGCCGATSSAATLFQSGRTAGGWQTSALTPKSPTPLVGLFAEQAPLWWSADLGRTIYTTPASYAAGNNRPGGPGATQYLDLYEQGPTGAMTWLTQGPFPGAGTTEDIATFDAASPDGQHVAFDSTERLTSDATGLADLNTPPQFLYERNVAAGTTNLVNVATTTLGVAAAAGDTQITVAGSTAFAANQSVTIGTGAGSETGTIASVDDATHITLSAALTSAHAVGSAVEALISPDGAILGDGNFLAQSFLAANIFGSTTNAISSDGSKLFFESPPSFPGGSGSAEGVGSPHLYMRNVATNTTTPLDDPSSTSQAIYEGAAQNGSLVFFSSNEGLAGDANTDNELYEFNTTGAAIGPAPAMSAIPISAGNAGDADGNVIGISAISNDGSHVWFIATGVLATNTGARGTTATDGADNFYVFNATNGQTTFIATLDSHDEAVLAAEPDTARSAIPTPDGGVLAFDSLSNLTGQNPSGPSPTLAADANPGDTTITVSSAAGLVVGRRIEIPSLGVADRSTILSISGTTVHLGAPLQSGHSAGDTVNQLAPFEIYRYSTTSNTLTCVSCTPAGVTATGPASMGSAGGGSYQPAGTSVPMSSNGSKIFFATPDPLVPADVNTGAFANGLFGATTFTQDVYEWENGRVSLISDGRTATGSSLGGTTPSGNDVFFTTLGQLVPQDTDGYDDIYDARVGGGFPAPPPSGGGCQSPDSCRPAVAPTVFFPTPSSSTLVAPPTKQPTFRVNSISAKQRKGFASTGKLTLTVHASAGGKLTARAYGKLAGGLLRMSSATATLRSVNGGKATLKLKLNAAARKALDKQHKLAVRIEVSYSQSGEVNVAALTLTKKKAKHAARRHKGKGAAIHHGAQERDHK
jgi:hypothetical protein